MTVREAPRRYIGLMSGTSMDGLDAGLLVVDGEDLRLEYGLTHALPGSIHGRLADLVANANAVSLDELGELDTALGGCFADAALALIDATQLAPRDIDAIGSHGQTVRHAPMASFPFTLQIGNPAVIAARTGIDTIADFRSRDVALGGQGAPLAPAFHQAAFASATEDRVVVNIGGISNVTILHRDGSVSGHDTGPGNVLLDAWCREHLERAYDADGAWARSGAPDRGLLDRLLAEPFFSRPPPKSTGRELFDMPWLTQHLIEVGHAPPPADVQATLCELTAQTIANAIGRYAPNANRVLFCGGGAHNGYLLERLAALLPCASDTTAAFGLEPDFVEAAAFAWLAWQFRRGAPGNIPAVTGANAPAILGSVTPGAR